MDEWKLFLQSTKVLVRKNKKILFRKRRADIFVDRCENVVQKQPVNQHVEKNFSKNEKKRFIAQATLDLHGYTEEQARTLLLDFLQQKKYAHVRDVIIITGGSENENKVLRKMFLKMVDEELSSLISKISCMPQNTGAFYVKLRRSTL